MIRASDVLPECVLFLAYGRTCWWNSTPPGVATARLIAAHSGSCFWLFHVVTCLKSDLGRLWLLSTSWWRAAQWASAAAFDLVAKAYELRTACGGPALRAGRRCGDSEPRLQAAFKNHQGYQGAGRLQMQGKYVFPGIALIDICAS